MTKKEYEFLVKEELFPLVERFISFMEKVDNPFFTGIVRWDGQDLHSWWVPVYDDRENGVLIVANGDVFMFGSSSDGFLNLKYSNLEKALRYNSSTVLHLDEVVEKIRSFLDHVVEDPSVKDGANNMGQFEITILYKQHDYILITIKFITLMAAIILLFIAALNT